MAAPKIPNLRGFWEEDGRGLDMVGLKAYLKIYIRLCTTCEEYINLQYRYVGGRTFVEVASVVQVAPTANSSSQWQF